MAINEAFSDVKLNDSATPSCKYISDDEIQIANPFFKMC